LNVQEHFTAENAEDAESKGDEPNAAPGDLPDKLGVLGALGGERLLDRQPQVASASEASS
jgi:hypothetical protein